MTDKQESPKARNESLPRTAVFIDGDWLIHAARQLKEALDFNVLMQSFRTFFGIASEIRIYLSVNPTDPNHNDFIHSLTSKGYRVFTAMLIQRGGRTISRGLDNLLSMDFVNADSIFDRLVLISGDLDFVPALNMANQRGCSTVVITLPYASSQGLTTAARYCSSLESFLQTGSHVGSPLAQRIPLPSTELVGEAYFRQGEHVRPYLHLRGIVKNAKSTVVVVDSYVNNDILLLFEVLNVEVQATVVTDKIQDPDFSNTVARFRKEGRRIRIIKSTQFHDRFLVVDGELWHSGHSFKDLGSKDSMMSKITDRANRDETAGRIKEAISKGSELFPAP